MANPWRTTDPRLAAASPRPHAADVVSVVATMASGCEADLRACQELAAAASTAAAGSTAAGGERSARVRELLDLVRKLERLPRAGSARPVTARAEHQR